MKARRMGFWIQYGTGGGRGLDAPRCRKGSAFWPNRAHRRPYSYCYAGMRVLKSSSVATAARARSAETNQSMPLWSRRRMAEAR